MTKEKNDNKVIDYCLLRGGADMKNYFDGQMKFTDRLAIEVGIEQGHSFKKIANVLHRHPTTVSNEIKSNRTFIAGNYPGGNDCRKARQCEKRHLCDEEYCNKRCRTCRKRDCHEICQGYVSQKCTKYDKPPYVCNRCKDKRICNKEKYIYSAKHAEAAVERRRSDSRRGIRLKGEKFNDLDKLVAKLINKGQPLTHIYAEHKDEIPISLRSLYNYIDLNEMTIRNIDLRRKTAYRKRRGNKRDKVKDSLNQIYRKGRTYEDYERAIKTLEDDIVVEMDTVKGVREKGKRLLTMIFRKNSVMLMFLMPDGKASSVKRVFDYLEMGLGIETFRKLFPIILTDNGSEFKRVEDIECIDELGKRTSIYFCDPMASWQKPHIEKNHEFIRYAIPRKRSLNPYTDEDIHKLMNNINSTRRPSLGNRSPYEIAMEQNDKDFKDLWDLMEMDLIPPDEVHLKPDMFIR